MHKKVLLMCLANPSKNPRPNRLINMLLEQNFQVHTIAYKSDLDMRIHEEFILHEPDMGKFYRSLRLFVKIIRFLLPSFSLKVKVTNFLYGLNKIDINLGDFDVVVVENIELLPIAFERNAKIVICDLREFYPLEFQGSMIWRFLELKFKTNLCRKYLKRCDGLITVSSGLAKGYRRFLKVDPTVVMSASNYVQFDQSKTNAKNIKMVHHGLALRDRKIENMIYLFNFLDDRFSLDFYLVGDESYINELKKIAKEFPQIRFQEPVPYSEIIPTMNLYDIGLYLLEPTGFNTRYSLPNKFFEYIQAGLMLAIGPSYDMKKIVKKFELGITSSTFKPIDLANKLNKLSPNQIKQYKTNVTIASKELCYENESQKILEIIGRF